MQSPIPQPQRPTGFFQSNTARLIMVGMLTLVLMIPLLLVQNLIDERARRKEAVNHEIAQKWGGDVYLYGPILRVPYTVYEETLIVDQKTKTSVTQRKPTTSFAYFFPEKLQNKANVATEQRSYGNYQSVVYTSNMKLDGSFVSPDFSSRNIPDADIQWDKAAIVIKTTNLKSIQDEVKILMDGKPLSFEPVFNNSENDTVDALETAYFDASALKGKTTGFKLNIGYRGSQQLLMVPIGKTTVVDMDSNWKSPSFTGNFLPIRKDSLKPFPASWKILHVNRPFSQQNFGNLPDLERFAFGVKFKIPVDDYQQNERASKYGFLTIGLTFLLFFLIQVMSGVRIHIFQYTMIGLALLMFYTLLLSITEHSSFLLAYVISGSAVVALISLYSIPILKKPKFSGFIATSLTALYAFIYVIIQLEDYALLFGSIGLFAILALVMYLSRKIDWNN